MLHMQEVTQMCKTKGSKNMNTAKAQKALLQVALKEGASLDEVRREIGLAISAAANSTDPQARAFWLNISPRKGQLPTPEEAILYIANMVAKQ